MRGREREPAYEKEKDLVKQLDRHLHMSAVISFTQVDCDGLCGGKAYEKAYFCNVSSQRERERARHSMWQSERGCQCGQEKAAARKVAPALSESHS